MHSYLILEKTDNFVGRFFLYNFVVCRSALRKSAKTLLLILTGDFVTLLTLPLVLVTILETRQWCAIKIIVRKFLHSTIDVLNQVIVVSLIKHKNYLTVFI